MKQAASDVADPDSWDVVFFDFEFSIWKDSPVDRWVKDDYQLQRMWWTEIYDVTVFTNHCFSTHWPTMRAWYDKGGPGIRVLFKLVATDDGGTEMSVVGEEDTTHIAPFSLGGYEAL
ncbi:hypothetical protein OF83DRAFT_1087174 [Amylostereum chailletii]|nr:hypothetical protein OF83DRAFT_1087174 [Amylostereum chailletii]